MSTKEKITYQALALFSVQGYEAVTIRQIAAAVGIKESSIYNHFSSKKEILETIVEVALARYDLALEEARVPKGGKRGYTAQYASISPQDFFAICSRIFLFYLKDEYIAKLRRLLTIEQYANGELGEIFRTTFIENVLERQRLVLQEFVDAGYFIPGDAYIMALHFYAPVFLLLYKYDNLPGREEQALAELEKHVRQYNELYLAEGDCHE